MNELRINGSIIKKEGRPYLIAEVAQAHDGSLGMAHAYIDAISEIGFDAVKYQTHIASSESTINEPFRIKFSRQDSSRYEYWKRMEFSYSQWVELKEHAESKGLDFLSSAFSIDAFQMLNEIGIPAWKMGSGEFWSEDLLSAMMETGKPLLISTGMSSWAEIDLMVKKLENKNYPHAFFI